MSLCAWLLFWTGAAAAPPDVTVSGAAGFSGQAVRATRTPVQIEVDNLGGNRDLVVAWAWAGSGRRNRTPASLDSLQDRRGPVHRVQARMPAHSRRLFTGTIRTPDGEGVSVWAFVSTPDGRAIAWAELPVRIVPEGTKLVAVVGSVAPGGLRLPGIETVLTRPSSLPEEWAGYESVSALVWLDGRTSDFRSAAQSQALKAWVSTGGQLIVARSHFAGLEGPPLLEMLPVSVRDSVELPGLFCLGSLGGVESAPAGPVSVARARVTRGDTLLSQGDLPIVAGAWSDGGRVLFVAFDPTRPPVAGWGDASRFWSWLLGVSAVERARPVERAPIELGTDPVARALTRFPDVAPPEFNGLFVVMGLYLLAVGPADYLLLRLLRRLELTWVTFPVTVAAFTVGVLILGGAFLRRAARQQDVVIEDHYAGSTVCRTRRVGAVLSPSDLTYSVRGAEPASSNLLDRTLLEDGEAETRGVTLLHGEDGCADGWTLRRGATGLLHSDRCSERPCPILYRVEDSSTNELTLRVSNLGPSDFDSAELLTQNGVFSIPGLPRGDREVRAIRRDWSSVPPARDPPEEPSRREIRQRLIDLCRPEYCRILPGRLLNLSVEEWLGRGGTVLLAWREEPEAGIELDPRPSIRSSLVLTRIFQELGR